MWYVHMTEYASATKKEIVPLAETRMDLETTTLSKVSQTKTNITRHHLYVEFKICHK